MFLDILASRGRGATPARCVLEGFFDKVSVLIFARQNRVSFILFTFVNSTGGTSGKSVPECFFDKVCVYFFPSKQSSFYVFGFL